MADQEHREDIGNAEQDLGHHTTEGERVAQRVDPVEGFHVHRPTADELDADDGYVNEPPDVAAADLAPSGESIDDPTEATEG